MSNIPTLADLRDAYRGLLIPTGPNSYEVIDETLADQEFDTAIAGIESALVQRIMAVVKERIDELKACRKKDSCAALAAGAELAYADIDWIFNGGEERFDEQ